MKAPVRFVGGPFTLLWFLLLFQASPAHAGMTVYDLTDVARLRLEDISFFAFLLLLATVGIRFLWNFLAKDFSRLPRLSFLRALSLTGLLAPFGVGQGTLREFKLTSWRYLDQPAPRLVPRALRKLKLARGLMVYEGLR